VRKSEIEKDYRKWSSLDSWERTGADGKKTKNMPTEDGESFVIEPHWNMLLDIEETPKFDKIEIRGRITFDQDTNIHLRAKKIVIYMGGELVIGSKKKPYAMNGKITLFGLKNDETVAIEDQGTEAGSKIIANLGLVSIYGQKRSFKETRLEKIANAGDTSIKIAAGLDLKEGDRIALAPTSFDYKAGEDVLVKSYNAKTGDTELNSALKFYHWGAEKSTKETYGVDMRGEVISLSRNIKIIGEDVETWGGQILTADVLGLDGEEHQGQLIMHNVEGQNLGQIDTDHAAIRFEKAISWSHEVKGCAFHNSWGMGIVAKQSQNIVVEDNALFSFTQYGVAMDEVKNIVFHNNILSVVKERTTLDTSSMSVDQTGGVLMCSLTFPKPCPNLRITNNIVAGSIYGGFFAPGHDCGRTNNVFKDNVAHSITGGGNGMGAVVYPDPSKPGHANCFESSHFAAYKCKYQGLYTRFLTKKVIFHNMVSVDNGMGLGMGIKQSSGVEYKPHWTELKDSKIYGEFGESPDCPPGGGFC